jgi:hypothetical protein
MAFTLSSPAFMHASEMPARFTGDGPDLSPPLNWGGAPSGTKSFALISDDPDAPDPAAPKRTWVHWVICDMPATSSALEEGASQRAMPAGAVEGRNDSGGVGYSGPYPPVGRHRYFFKLYALDVSIGLPPGHTKAQLLKAIEGHVLAKAELMATYER